MDNLRIAVRDPLDKNNLTFLDNSIDGAIHFSTANLTRYFDGNASVVNLVIDKRHEDESLVVEGNKIAFVWRDRDYWLNIFKAEDNGHKRSLLCLSLSLELNNETLGPYEATKAMSFAEYLKVFDPEGSLVLGVNEVSDKKLKLSWEGSDTILARLYSLANKFSAEIGFDTELNDDYSLSQHVINAYIKNDKTHQGLGRNRSGETLRVGKELKLISRTGSIEGLKTAIHALGADGISLVGYDKKEYDANGNLEFYVNEKGELCAPLARDRYPAISLPDKEGFILEERGETEYKTQADLYGYLLSELKKICYPITKYATEGFFESDPGDTFSLEDSVYYNPTLLLEARVTNQTESMIGDKSQNQTEFGSFVEVKSQISDDLTAKVNALKESLENNYATKQEVVEVTSTIESVKNTVTEVAEASKETAEKVTNVEKVIDEQVITIGNISSEQITLNDKTQEIETSLEDKADLESLIEGLAGKVDDEELNAIKASLNDITSKYQEFVSNKYASDLETLESRLEGLVTDLGEQIATFNFLTKYIKLGEEGLVIGSNENSLKMILGNDTLAFTDGGKTVAYFNNQSFYNTRGVITDSSQVGSHKQSKINGDYTVVQWVRGGGN